MIQKPLVWRSIVTTAVAMSLAIGGCGGSNPADSGNGQLHGRTTNQLSVSLAAKSALVEKASTRNLIDMSGAWLDWSGAQTDVTYSDTIRALQIPALQGEFEVAVRRYDIPLVSGHAYEFAVQSALSGAAAILFLFDSNGDLVPIPGSDTDLGIARSDQVLRFTAPIGVAGFYVQVQNGWQANDAISLQAELRETNNATSGTGENLIDLRGDWTDWSGGTGDVTVMPDGSALTIGTNNSAGQLAFGVLRSNKSLTAGSQYELTVSESSDPKARALLFLVHETGQIVRFVDLARSLDLPWLSASPSLAQRFVAPPGIVGYALQVQSGWQSNAPVNLTPELRLTAGPFSDGIPLSLSPTPVTCRTTRTGALTFDDTGPMQQILTVRDRTLIAGNETDNYRNATCRMPSPGVPSPPFTFTRSELDTGDVAYEFVEPLGPATAYGRLLVDRDGNFRSCRNWFSGRVSPRTSVCGDGWEDLPEISPQVPYTPIISAVRVGIDGDAVNRGASDDPSISSDGRIVAYQRLDSSNERWISDVVIAWLDSGARLRLNGNHNSYSPKVSRDGRFVLFSSDASDLVVGDTNNQRDLFIYDLTSTGLTRIATNTAVQADISDDGNLVAFVRNHPAANPNGPQTQSVVFINREQDIRYEFTGFIDRSGPRVTGDGTLAVFSGELFGRRDGHGIFSVNTRTGELEQLTALNHDSSPVLSQNARWLAYFAPFSVQLLDLASGSQRTIAISPITPPLFGSLVFARGDQRLLFATQEYQNSISGPLALAIITAYDIATGTTEAFWSKNKLKGPFDVTEDGTQFVFIDGDDDVYLGGP